MSIGRTYNPVLADRLGADGAFIACSQDILEEAPRDFGPGGLLVIR